MGTERKVIDSVHRQLSSDIHRESMTGGFKNGRPDYYYDGLRANQQDLWLEWKELKFVDEMWLTFEGTMLQLRWQKRRYVNGRNAFFIGGDGKGKFALVAGLNIEVVKPIGKDGKRFLMRAGYAPFQNAKEVARWIESFCFGKSGSA